MKRVALCLREVQLDKLKKMAREWERPWAALVRYAIDGFLFANQKGPPPDEPLDGRRRHVRRVRDPRGRFTRRG